LAATVALIFSQSNYATSCDRMTRHRLHHGTALQRFRLLWLRIKEHQMDDRPRRLRGSTTENVLVAALIVGFVWALGFALDALYAVVKDAGSSLAAIARIGT
jgi:hypothetical protein